MRPHDFRRLALAHELLARAVPVAPMPSRQARPGDSGTWPPSTRPGAGSCDPAGPGLGFEASVPAQPEVTFGLM